MPLHAPSLHDALGNDEIDAGGFAVVLVYALGLVGGSELETLP